jgi:hypothetical protein
VYSIAVDNDASRRADADVDATGRASEQAALERAAVATVHQQHDALGATALDHSGDPG